MPPLTAARAAGLPGNGDNRPDEQMKPKRTRPGKRERAERAYRHALALLVSGKGAAPIPGGRGSSANAYVTVGQPSARDEATVRTILGSSDGGAARGPHAVPRR
jgi:hypothetical protein